MQARRGLLILIAHANANIVSSIVIYNILLRMGIVLADALYASPLAYNASSAGSRGIDALHLSSSTVQATAGPFPQFSTFHGCLHISLDFRCDIHGLDLYGLKMPSALRRNQGRRSSTEQQQRLCKRPKLTKASDESLKRGPARSNRDADSSFCCTREYSPLRSAKGHIRERTSFKGKMMYLECYLGKAQFDRH